MNELFTEDIPLLFKRERRLYKMGIMYEELDDELILKDLGEVCLTTSSCGECAKDQCLIGYAKKCLMDCIKENVTYVENGIDGIPLADTKLFHEEELAKGIADILKLCKSCGEMHFDNCIINVLRSSYEVALFGDVQSYKGSAFAYLSSIGEKELNHVPLVLEEYNKEE